MTLNYHITTKEGSFRTIHNLTINGETIKTTGQKEILHFGRARITDRLGWKHFKEAVRLGEPLTIDGGE